jgi:hypothetical protein
MLGLYEETTFSAIGRGMGRKTEGNKYLEGI